MPEPPEPPCFSSTSERLTSAEVVRLRQHGKALIAYARAAFAGRSA